MRPPELAAKSVPISFFECTSELKGRGLHTRIASANPTVRTRKHEVVTCSVAVSRRPLLWNNASPKKPNDYESKPRSYRPAGSGAPVTQGARRRDGGSNGRLDHLTRPATAEVASSFAITPMKGFQASIEKLRKDAAEAAMIRDLATAAIKREMFDRLSEHLNRLADEVEQAMTSAKSA